jgi:hypothetical protein
LTVPVILKYHDLPREELYKRVSETIATIRKTPAMQKYSQALTDILVDLLNGSDIRTTVESVGKKYLGYSV